jgi:Rieske 2Fe-2S family protein
MMQTAAGEVAPAPAALTRELYISPEVFEREVELLLYRTWLYAGHASQLPRVGDYLLRHVGDESIIVVRSAPDELHAFYNVCRHRGSLLCDADTGHERRFVCPYHQWAFALDGTLETAPGLRDGEDGVRFADLGLNPVRLELSHGLMFVNLHPDAAPLRSRFYDDCEVALARGEQTKVAYEKAYRMKANWKLVSENLTECYHCPGAHPEFSRVCDVGAMYRRASEPAREDETARRGLPLRGAAETLTIDGKPDCAKLLGAFGEGLDVPVGFNTMHSVGPVPCLAAYFVDYAVLFDVRPISPTETDFFCQWFVHEDAVEGADYVVDELIELWDVTTLQDVVLCERQQAGVTSRSYRPGPTTTGREAGTIARGFLGTYLSVMDGAGAAEQ